MGVIFWGFVNSIYSLRTTFENNPHSPCPPKNPIVQGEEGVETWNPNIFVTEGLTSSFGTLGQLFKNTPYLPKIA